MHRLSRVRQPEREQEAARRFAGEHHPHITEIDLRLRARKMVLQHESRLRRPPRLQRDLPAARRHIVPHARIRQLAHAVLVDEPSQHAPGRVTLLAVRGQVLAQHRVDQRFRRIKLRRDHRPRLAGRRDSGHQRRSHGAPVHAMALRQRSYRQALSLGVPADRFEQMHARRPHPGPLQQAENNPSAGHTRAGPSTSSKPPRACRQWGQIWASRFEERGMGGATYLRHSGAH